MALLLGYPPQLQIPTAIQGNLPEAEPCGLQASPQLEDKLGLLKWMLFMNYIPEYRKSPCNNHRKLKPTSGGQPHSLAMLMHNARKSLCRCFKNALGAFLEDAALVRPHPTTKEQLLEMPIILLPADLCCHEPRSKGGRRWRMMKRSSDGNVKAECSCHLCHSQRCSF